MKLLEESQERLPPKQKGHNVKRSLNKMLKKSRQKRKIRIRSRLSGTSKRPRLSVFRSNKYIYGQIIDDEKGLTLAASYGTNPKEVGERLGQLALKKKIKAIVFDRSGYRYHGKIKILADSLREKGVNF